MGKSAFDCFPFRSALENDLSMDLPCLNVEQFIAFRFAARWHWGRLRDDVRLRILFLSSLNLSLKLF